MRRGWMRGCVVRGLGIAGAAGKVLAQPPLVNERG